MAASTAAALKVAFLLVAMLLHSSMGQQPAPAPAPMPPSDCPRYCTSRCTPLCQADSDAAARRCDTFRPEVAYASCFDGCAGKCNGNSGYARGSCAIGTCSPSACGCPCAQRCCESCTGSAYGPYSMCMSGQSKYFSYCLSSCTNDCNRKCVNGSVAYP